MDLVINHHITGKQIYESVCDNKDKKCIYKRVV
jgi:hypothetical protein